MKIYVHLQVLGTSFRRQNDGSLRRFGGQAVDDDYFTEDYFEAARVTFPDQLTLEGKKYRVNLKELDATSFGETLYTSYYVIHEKHDPVSLPDIEQLRTCLLSGNDRRYNKLVLTVDGEFILTNEFTTVPDPYVACRFETFVAGNNYVGKSAAQDDIFVKDLFVTGLKNYLVHLESGRTCMYSDLFESPKEIDGLTKRIATVIENIGNQEE